MKVRIIQTAVTDVQVFSKGKTYNVSASVGASLIKSKFAVEVVEEVRTATKKPTSTATKKPSRTPRTRKKK